jgi:hypothetical protein
MNSPVTNGHVEPDTPPPKRPVFLYHRIIAYLLSQGNDWRSTQQLATALSVKTDAIRQTLYTAHHDHLFERHYPTPRRVLWRTRPEARKAIAQMPELLEASEPAIEQAPKPKGPRLKYGPEE